MDTLCRFYKNWLRFAFIGVALLGVLIGTWASNGLARYSGTIAGLLFIVVEAIIGKWLWKIFHRNLIIEGTWDAETTYEEVTIPAELKDKGIPVLELPHTSRHEAKFLQDCLSLAIQVTGGEDFPRFYSLAVDMIKDKAATRVRYAYRVEYKHGVQNGCPQNMAIGYEDMTIDKYEDLKWCRKPLAIIGILKAKPIRMTGYFYHCARKGGVAYRGSVKFWRRSICESELGEKNE